MKVMTAPPLPLALLPQGEKGGSREHSAYPPLAAVTPGASARTAVMAAFSLQSLVPDRARFLRMARFSGIIPKTSRGSTSCPSTNMRAPPAARSSRSWSVSRRPRQSARTATAMTCARSCRLLPRQAARLRVPGTCPAPAEVAATRIARAPAVFARGMPLASERLRVKGPHATHGDLLWPVGYHHPQ